MKSNANFFVNKSLFILNYIEKLIIIYALWFFIGHLVFFDSLPAFTDKDYAIPSLVIFSTIGVWALVKSSAVSLFLTAICWYLLYYINPFVSFISFLPTAGFLFFLSLRFKYHGTPSEKKVIYYFLIFLVFHYSQTGLGKLYSESWTNGTALQTILSSPLSRVSDLVFFSENTTLWKILTYSVIAFELSAPILFFKRIQNIYILALIGFHIALGLSLNIFQLSIPYILIWSWFYFYFKQKAAKLI